MRPLKQLLHAACAVATALLLVGCKPEHKKDPRVDQAVAEARASLTNFIGVLQSPKTNQLFFRVLAWLPSKSPYAPEAVWANVWKYENGAFLGAVPQGNQFLGLTNNQPVRIPASNVLDWAYMDFDKGVVGDFVARSLQGESNPPGSIHAKPAVGTQSNRTAHRSR